MTQEQILPKEEQILPKVTTRLFTLSQNLQAVAWKIISCGCFAGINVIVRYLEKGTALAGSFSTADITPLPANVIMFFQNIVGTLLLLPLLFFSFRRSRKESGEANRYSGAGHAANARVSISPLYSANLWLHTIRVIAAVLGVWFMYLALKYMTIAEAVALSFTGPVFTIIGAKLLLKESIGGRRSIAIILSILGAFIITRPDLVLTKSSLWFGVVVCLPLASAITLAWNKLLTRQLAMQGESPERLAVYLLLGMVPVSLIPALFEWTMPTAQHWFWLCLLGVLAAGAHISFGKAYRLAEVTFLSPFGFSKFLFSAFLGYYCFLEIPKPSLWIGMAVISLSIFALSAKNYKISLYSIARRFRSN